MIITKRFIARYNVTVLIFRVRARRCGFQFGACDCSEPTKLQNEIISIEMREIKNSHEYIKCLTSIGTSVRAAQRTPFGCCALSNKKNELASIKNVTQRKRTQVEMQKKTYGIHDQYL